MIRLGFPLFALLLVACPRQTPVTSGEVSSEPPPSETSVEVTIGAETAPAAPTFTFDWPREGRLGVQVFTTMEWTSPEDGDQRTEEEASWTWTLAGAQGGDLRMANSGTPRSVVARSDGTIVSSSSDAETLLWTQLVQHWVGRSAETGSAFESDGVLSVVGFEGANGPAILRSVVVGRVPCKDPNRDLRCTELELRAELQGDSSALVAELQGRLKDDRSLRDVEVLEHARLRTVGSSLQPHRLEVERITRLRFRAPDGTEATERIREGRVYTFDWSR